jgi:hypothetical protein
MDPILGGLLPYPGTFSDPFEAIPEKHPVSWWYIGFDKPRIDIEWRKDISIVCITNI